MGLITAQSAAESGLPPVPAPVADTDGAGAEPVVAEVDDGDGDAELLQPAASAPVTANSASAGILRYRMGLPPSVILTREDR